MNPVNLTKPPRLSNRAARKLFLDRHGLGRPPDGEDLARLIERLGFVQIDSIATVERAHHMILASRRRSYWPQQLALSSRNTTVPMPQLPRPPNVTPTCPTSPLRTPPTGCRGASMRPWPEGARSAREEPAMPTVDLTPRLARDSKSGAKDTILFDRSLPGFGLRTQGPARRGQPRLRDTARDDVPDRGIGLARARQQPLSRYRKEPEEQHRPVPRHGRAGPVQALTRPRRRAAGPPSSALRSRARSTRAGSTAAD